MQALAFLSNACLGRAELCRIAAIVVLEMSCSPASEPQAMQDKKLRHFKIGEVEGVTKLLHLDLIPILGTKMKI
jgi:hypothetical protein